MEDGFLGLPFTVEGTDGTTYEIRPYEATVEGIEELWERAGKFRFLFTEFSKNDRDRFIQYFLQPGVIVVECWRLDEDPGPVGILYADQVRLQHSARVHYFFWDKVQRTREPVILRTLKWFMEEFDLHRVGMEIPWFAYSALRRVHSMNIKPEGIRREFVKTSERWSDEILFSILDSELENADFEAGKLESSKFAENWFGLLENEDALKKAIFKRE